MGVTSIEWCDYTFNPFRGCTKISEGCKFCYADTLSKRNPSTLGVWGPNGTRVVAAESAWKEPLKWNRQAAEREAAFKRAMREIRSEYDGQIEWHRPRVFCASLADVFEGWTGPMTDSSGEPLLAGRHFRPKAPADEPWWEPGDGDDHPLSQVGVMMRAFDLARRTPNLDWLFLTKRPQHVLPMIAAASQSVYSAGLDDTIIWLTDWAIGKLPANVWLGVSVEDQQRADERIPELLKIPAKVRFLSVEPLLGPVNIRGHCLGFDAFSESNPGSCQCGHGHGFTRCQNTGGVSPTCHHKGCNCPGFRRVAGQGIHWAIVGGESGWQARPFDLTWARSLRDQCKDAGVPYFFKQAGSNPVAPVAEIVNESDGKVHYRRPLNDPCVEEARHTPGYVVREGRDGLMLHDRKGGDLDELPEDLRIREFPEVEGG